MAGWPYSVSTASHNKRWWTGNFNVVNSTTSMIIDQDPSSGGCILLSDLALVVSLTYDTMIADTLRLFSKLI